MLQYEQMPKLAPLPIIGFPLATGWSQVCETNNHQVCFALAIAGNNATNIGRDISQKIKQITIKNAQELHQFCLDLLAHIHQLGNQIQFAGTLLEDGKYTFITYQGLILLKRNLKVGVILTSDKELKLIQGRAQEDDSLVLATADAHYFVKEAQLKLEQGYQAAMIATSLVTGITSYEDSATMALAIVQQQNRTDLAKISQEKNKELTINLDLDFADQPPSTQSSATSEQIVTKRQSEETLINIVESTTALDSKQPTTTAKSNKTRQMGLLLKNLSQKIITTVGQTAQNLFSLLPKIKKGFSLKNQYIQTLPNDKKRKMILVIVAALGLILGSIFGFRWFKNQQIKQAQTKIQPMLNLFAQAQQLVDSDPFQARTLTQESIDKLQQLRPYFEHKPYAKKIIEENLTQQRTFYDTISGKEESQNLNVFLDLQQLENNLLASLVAANDNYLIIIDQEQKILLLVDLTSKQKYQFYLSKEIPELSEAKIKDIVLTSDSLYLLANGLYRLQFEINDQAQLKIEQLKKEGDSDRGGTFINNYLSYFYIFNPEKRNIYRFNYDDGVLSEPIGWLISKEGLDFNQINDMTVDGDLWLSTKAGQIKKFTKGYEDTDFKLTGLPEELTNPLYIYTNENLNYVYLFDPQQSKLISITKDGKFYKELKSRSLAGVTRFAISPKNKQIFAISGSVIFEIPLDN